MVLDLIDKLIDKLLDLSRERERVDQNLFEESVHPTFITFEALHENYITSFQKYQAALEGNPALCSEHTVFADIVRDSLARRTLRNKLRTVQASYSSASDLAAFVASIAVYLSFGGDRFPAGSLTENEEPELAEASSRFRHWLSLQREAYRKRAEPAQPNKSSISVLWEYGDLDSNDPAKCVAEYVYEESVTYDDTQGNSCTGHAERAIVAIDSIIQRLQTNHLRVVTEYEKLRHSLVTPMKWRPTEA